MIEKAVFLGSKKFGLEIFRALHEAKKNISWKILCPVDDKDLRSNLTQFKKFARQKNIQLIIVQNPNEITEFVKKCRPDIMIVCGYYRILPEEIFKIISEGVWGIHNSLLPKYRGGSPLVWQIINKEKILGSTFFKFAKDVDNGPILDQVKIKHLPNITIGKASDMIENEWLKKIPSLWINFCKGNLKPKPQDHKKATYCAQRQETDGEINWNNDATSIDAFIRAQDYPYPKAFFKFKNKIIKINKHQKDIRIISGSVGQIFEVRQDYVTVCCGNYSAIRLLEIEVQGKILSPCKLIKSIKDRLE